MPALITEEISDGPDTVDALREAIAAILKVESENQVQLKRLAGKQKESDEWRLRVFTNRSSPWEQFSDAPQDERFVDDRSPLVHVGFSTDTVFGNRGDLIKTQVTSATFWLDCYGCGAPRGTGGGHIPGDYSAWQESSRACRNVRRILMSAHYLHLGMRGIVGKRTWSGRERLDVPIGERGAQHIACTRLSFVVDFSESATPQHVPSALQTIFTEVRRDTLDGEVLLTAEFSLS